MSEIPGIIAGLHQKISYVQKHIANQFQDLNDVPNSLSKIQNLVSQSQDFATKATDSANKGDVTSASAHANNSSRLLTQALGKYTKLVPAEDIPYELADMSMGTPVLDHHELVNAANKERNNGS
jgi:hypothetical protein